LIVGGKATPTDWKTLPQNAFAFASNRKAPSVFFYGYLLKRFKVLFDIRPLKYVASSIQTALKLFSQNKRVDC